MTNENLRSEERRADVLIRMSRSRREELKALAEAAGVSVQVYAEAKLFDEPFKPARLPHNVARTRRPRGSHSQSEELPLTG